MLQGRLRDQTTAVVEAANLTDVPRAVSRYLSDSGLSMRVRSGEDAALNELPWRETGIEIVTGCAKPLDAIGLSTALAGVAETGTLVLASSPANPTTLAFLPETHIVVLEAADIVATYEDAFIRVRKIYGAGCMPRTLNFISGPSRTGDIGGRIVFGAHGPKRLAVVIVRIPGHDCVYPHEKARFNAAS